MIASKALSPPLVDMLPRLTADNPLSGLLAAPAEDRGLGLFMYAVPFTGAAALITANRASSSNLVLRSSAATRKASSVSVPADDRVGAVSMFKTGVTGVAGWFNWRCWSRGFM